MKQFVTPEVTLREFTFEDVLTLSSVPPAGPDPLPTIDPDEGVII